MDSGNHGIISRLLREPLLHFLVLGAGLFGLYSLVNDEEPARPDRIVVDEQQVSRLAEQFRRTWMRPPTGTELEGLAEDFVREEILYREALAMGLDRDDLVIRRRMRQKMEFLNADLVEIRQPTDADLQAWLERHPDRYRTPGTISFEQVYVDPERGEHDPNVRAAKLLRKLNAGEIDSADAGDPTLLPPALENATTREVSSTFGGQLAAELRDAPEGTWSGPYASAFGLHLVRVTGNQPPRQPALREVRRAVERDWSSNRQREADDRFYEALRARYQVEIRLPETVRNPPAVARGS